MRKRIIIINFTLVLTMLFALSTPATVFAETAITEFQKFEADPPPPEPDNPYFSSEQAGSLDGNTIIKNTIGGPPKPPEGYAIERSSTSLPVPNKEAGINIISEVPVFDWSYGCSATSGAM
ncbi:MAG: hypothetical protein K8R77_01815, partial [Anaerolineaceae bacterium]|nr:hypothetical protein [Anaerolineaceae bacterium]